MNIYWRLGIVLALVLSEAGMYLFGHHKGYAQGREDVQALWDKDKIAQQQANLTAVAQREKENDEALTQQALAAKKVSDVKDQELDSVRTKLANSERLRVGPSFCGSVSPVARTSVTSSPGSSDGTDTSARVLPATVDADIKQLILDMETDAATGRAAQAWIRENHLAP